MFTQFVGDRFSGISGLALAVPIAAIFTAPLGLPQALAGSIGWGVLLLIAGIALLSPVISFGLEMLALRRMTHTSFGTLLAIEPAFGVLAGLVLLGQSPALMQIAGVALVVVAGAAAQRGGERQL